MIEERPRTHYETLDIPMNATPETIREAYVRAKNAYSSQSLAAYSLFSPEESKSIIEEIEFAYTTLSDSDKRKRYDLEHGFMVTSSDTTTPNYPPSLFFEQGEEVANIGFIDDFEEDYDDTPRTSLQSQSEDSYSLNFGNRSSTGGFMPEENSGREYLGTTPFSAPSVPIVPETSSEFRTGPTNHFALHGHYIQRPVSDREQSVKELLDESTEINGALLGKIRELKGISMNEIMDFTKLSRKYVDAIETDDLEKLPASVYVRGFVTQYAKALRLDTTVITAGYMRNFQKLRESRGIR